MLEPHNEKSKKLWADPSNPWMRRFMNGVCDIFGLPASGAECANASDRMMFSWAMLHMARAIKDYPELLDELQEAEPVPASEEFVRRVYDMTGELIIPCIPSKIDDTNNRDFN